MSHNELYLHKRPSGSEEELDVATKEILNTFFEDYGLDEAHNNPWKLLKASFIADPVKSPPTDYPGLIYFYERMHTLLIAAAILYSDRERKRCTSPS